MKLPEVHCDECDKEVDSYSIGVSSRANGGVRISARCHGAIHQCFLDGNVVEATEALTVFRKEGEL